jgi:rhomboid family GlyGly-CTERM serine protease
MSEAFPAMNTPGARNRAWWLFGLLALSLVLVSLLGENGRLALRYERSAVLANHEWWRLVSGHLVHGSPRHLLLNGAGLALVALLFARDYSVRAWLLILAFSVAAIDVGFVLFEPQLQWYVGLSGVLHGAMAAGAVAWWRHETKPLALALTLALAAKLAWEQWHGALPFSGDMPVIVDAHLYGPIGGVLAGALIWICTRDWSAARPSL